MNVPSLFKRNSTRSPEPENPLTQEQDENLKASLGLSILQALDNHAVTDETLRKRRLWNDLHFAVERGRLGLGSATTAEDEMPQTTVRIDSNDEFHHHHYAKGGIGGLAAAAITAASLLGGGGIGFGIWQAMQPAVEKLIPGIDTETTVKAGQTIVE